MLPIQYFVCQSDFFHFFLSHCVQLPSVCIISGKFPGVAYVDILLNFSGLDGKRWGRATCDSVCTNWESTDQSTLNVQYSMFTVHSDSSVTIYLEREGFRQVITIVDAPTRQR